MPAELACIPYLFANPCDPPKHEDRAAFAVLLLPIAVDESALALEPDPIATVKSVDAPLLLPIATASLPLAVFDKPIATEESEELVDQVPIFTE